MRRLALIFGMFLTLTAGVWSNALAAASAWCMHEASAPTATASDEHDCCRAKIGEPNAHHSESPLTSHDAAHETSVTQNQSGDARTGMSCGGAHASSTTEIDAASLGGRDPACAECCAGGSGKTPATAVVFAPEQNKVKRDAGEASCAGAANLFASMTLDVSHLAASQHAPPVPPHRRHVLISVFLI